MSKFKIEIKIDIDFQKFFDAIPEGLYSTNEGPNEDYEKSTIYKVISDCHKYEMQRKMEWIAKGGDLYKYAEHHINIEQEIGRQIAENAKIVSYEK
jgi:hypothetical protein